MMVTDLPTGRYWFGTVEVSWIRAKKTCTDYGLDLLTIRTKKENDVIINYLNGR